MGCVNYTPLLKVYAPPSPRYTALAPSPVPSQFQMCSICSLPVLSQFQMYSKRMMCVTRPKTSNAKTMNLFYYLHLFSSGFNAELPITILICTGTEREI